MKTKIEAQANNAKNLMEMPLAFMTGAQFLELNSIIGQGVDPPSAERDTTAIPKYVYGIKGIAELFGCSAATASRIKKDGVIKEAITQFKRTIVVDTEKALELMKERKGRKEF